jgi:hypothetical protein
MMYWQNAVFAKMPIWQKDMLTKWRITINAGVFVSTLHNPNHICTFIYKKNVKKLNHQQHCKNIIFIETNSGKQKQYYLC